MNSGIYITASGMGTMRDRMDTVANNLGNVSTPGYKRDQGTINTFHEMLMYARGGSRGSQRMGGTGFGANYCRSSTDFEPGPVKETNRNTDLALVGNGFFVLEGENGRLYTRDGTFGVDGEGYLTGVGGRRVLGEQGVIRLSRQNEPPSDIRVDQVGNITVEGRNVDRLLIWDFDNLSALEKSGDNCYRAGRDDGHNLRDRGMMVKQGFLEQSNVDLTNEIVDMMAVMRAYEAGQKVLHAQDELTERVLRVGSMR